MTLMDIKQAMHLTRNSGSMDASEAWEAAEVLANEIERLQAAASSVSVVSDTIGRAELELLRAKAAAFDAQRSLEAEPSWEDSEEHINVLLKRSDDKRALLKRLTAVVRDLEALGSEEVIGL